MPPTRFSRQVPGRRSLRAGLGGGGTPQLSQIWCMGRLSRARRRSAVAEDKRLWFQRSGVSGGPLDLVVEPRNAVCLLPAPSQLEHIAPDFVGLLIAHDGRRPVRSLPLRELPVLELQCDHDEALCSAAQVLREESVRLLV